MFCILRVDVCMDREAWMEVTSHEVWHVFFARYVYKAVHALLRCLESFLHITI